MFQDTETTLTMSITKFVMFILLLRLPYIAFSIIKSAIKRFFAKRKLQKLFPGPEEHWLFGNLHTFPGLNEAGLMWFLDIVAKYPRYHIINSGPLRPSLNLNHPETIKQVTNTYAPKQTGPMGAYRMVMPWIGEGLLVSSGPKWKRNRRLLTPGFHFDVLKPYVGVYNDSVERSIKTLKSYARAEKSIDIFPLVSQCTLDIILRCAFSEDDSNKSDKKSSYVKAVVSMGDELLCRLINPLMYIDFIYYLTPTGRQFKKNCQLSHDVAMDVIHRRMKELNDTDTLDTIKSKGRYVDFLDILLLAKDEDGNGLTEKVIYTIFVAV